MDSKELCESYVVGDTIILRSDLLASLVKIDEALFLFIQEKYYYTINQELKVLSVETYIFSRPLKCLQHNNTNLYQLLIISWKQKPINQLKSSQYTRPPTFTQTVIYLQQVTQEIIIYININSTIINLNLQIRTKLEIFTSSAIKYTFLKIMNFQQLIKTVKEYKSGKKFKFQSFLSIILFYLYVTNIIKYNYLTWSKNNFHLSTLHSISQKNKLKQMITQNWKKMD
ncbi:Hypothetical_protein [Hexamita inflata]|uniref:Hypothetical_protein n=1 Tax=Hexamita inflata TaxID=28002 RepID=A0AA86R4K2_9EUKA|nr:Hypothetical protein HINF_LOCUS59224 [Hexamita inflata]